MEGNDKLIKYSNIYFKGGNLTFRPSPKIKEWIADYHEDLTGTAEPLENSRKFFECVLETALDNRKDSSATIKELEILKAENKQLKEALKLSESNALETQQNNSKASQNVEILQNERNQALELAKETEKRNAEKSDTIAHLEEKLSILHQQVNSRIKLTDNQFIVTGNAFFMELLKEYMESEKIKGYFSKANKGGMLDGFIDAIDSDNWRDNAQKLLKNVFVNSSCGYVLYDLKTRKQIKQIFENSIKHTADA